jgi:MoxR-like ATPase
MGDLLRTFTIDRNIYRRNAQASAQTVMEQIGRARENEALQEKIDTNIRAALASFTGIFVSDGNEYRLTDLADTYESLYLSNPVDAWQWLLTRTLWHYVIPNGTNAGAKRHAERLGISFNFFTLILGLLVHLQAFSGQERFLYYLELCALLDDDAAWGCSAHELFARLMERRAAEGVPHASERTFLGDLENEYGIGRDNLNGLFHKAFKQTGLFDFCTVGRKTTGIALSSDMTGVMQRRVRHVLDHPLTWDSVDWSDFLQLKAQEEDLPIEVSHPQELDDKPAQIAFERAPVYTLEDLENETGFQRTLIEAWKNNLDRKMHIVFQGPPGTGKTFVAQRLARLQVSDSMGFWEVVQFHPAYTYEDFMQGVFPETTPDGDMYYRLKPGRFLEFCTRAQSSEVGGSPCVLIIDEMNRANLSRVFGELMYLLEYRDKSIPLAGGGTFRIPSNVYIIGTMNTADRSIALVDHALRRRFVFVRLSPEYEILKAHLERFGLPADSLLEVLQLVNREIGMPDYELGISFFMCGDTLARSLPDIWKGEVEPYLEEFFFDQPERVQPFRWNRLKERELKDWAELNTA